MFPAVQLARIEQALREISVSLAKSPASPRTREYRARLSTFERACMSLSGREPRPEQVAALLESVLELHARVFEGGAVPRVPSLPSMAVANAMRAAMTNPRMGLPAPRASQRPTAKPPPMPSRPPSTRSSPPNDAVTMPPPPSRRG